MEEENMTGNPENGADAAPYEAQSEKRSLLGKFRDVDALMRAYKELEAEFTRRSQKLKALEESAPQGADIAGATRESGGIVNAGATPEQRVPLMASGGAGVTAPVRKPKTIREAGNMALGYLRGQKY